MRPPAWEPRDPKRHIHLTFSSDLNFCLNYIRLKKASWSLNSFFSVSYKNPTSALATCFREGAEPKEIRIFKMDQGGENPASFTSALSLTQMGVSRVPRRYILPPLQRNSYLDQLLPADPLPMLDLAALRQPSQRSIIVRDLGRACRDLGFFQVINHGISPLVTQSALGAASEFFDLPVQDKMVHFSDDINAPVRYGTSVNHKNDQVHFWRDFLKHYAHPLSNWINSWPSKPPEYRNKMSKYAREVRELSKELMGAIFESLGLEGDYLRDEMEEGSQVMAVNCYPPCPEPELALGMPPHSDYSCLTILVQDRQGLQIKEEKSNKWISVPATQGALLVHVGDHLEVLSNGRYKSVVHRATVDPESRRLSIASFHTLSMQKKVRPAEELVDKQHPIKYKESSFADFLQFLSATDITQLGRKYIDTLRVLDHHDDIN
ncbi:hypothetical protein H6P81_007362 [Aristolochia fimbriata]|uniref:Fe2OG dioxygenase domain-containing protein n=1 Tax=Aristolochia fimbriata TaxID=158543 RepID=A0AAV7F4H0_ARIFI|nr:hypothetical protein H6P81_007362 [Aristolochia fimbriata]